MLVKFVFRNLKKRLVLNAIKLVGLSLGLLGLLFISLFLKYELEYDGHHKRADQIFRLTTTDPNFAENGHFARINTSEEIPDLVQQLPPIEKYVRMVPIRGKLVLYDEQYYNLDQGFGVDSTFFEVFDAKLLRGNISSVYKDPNSLIISETFARKIFGTEDPVGKMITLPQGHFNAEKKDFIVKGVMVNFPQQSHFHPDFLFSVHSDEIGGWAYTYFLLNKQADKNLVAANISEILTERIQEDDEGTITAHLQNISEIHLKSQKFREIEFGGNVTNMYLLSLAGFILLFISLSNFAGLNVGMAVFLKKFIALNQVLGSTKKVAFKYFFIESIIVLLLSVALVLIALAPLNTMVEENYHINLLQGNAVFVGAVIGVYFLLGMLAGVYVAFRAKTERFISRENAWAGTNANGYKAVMIMQYGFAMLLFVAVLVVSKQMNYAMKHAMGSKENNVLCLNAHSDIQQKFQVFKSELLKTNTIESVSAMMDAPGSETHDRFAYDMPGRAKKEENEYIGVFPCDYSIANVFGLHFLSGRNFTEDNRDIGEGEYIINETAMAYLGFQDPNNIVDHDFSLISPVPGVALQEGKIIGVVEDFHLSGLQSKIEPLVLFKRTDSWLNNIVISYEPNMHNAALSSVQKVWAKLFPKHSFSYKHVRALYENTYKTEMLQAKLLKIFTGASLFICSMGILGWSLLISHKRVKEIGIRKVNGASIFEVLTVLIKDFVKGLAWGFLFAMPVAWYVMQKWLQSFAYKTELSWWIFALAGLSTLLIVIVTVSFQSLKAAMANPIKSLRTE